MHALCANRNADRFKRLKPTTSSNTAVSYGTAKDYPIVQQHQHIRNSEEEWELRVLYYVEKG